MRLLALDTSTRQASLALCSDAVLFGEYIWQIGNNHSVELLNAIQRLTAECQIPLPEIDAIAVATGPGSFNGVRVALATAKALAFSLHKPLVGVGTLDIIAAQQQQWSGPICAVLEAGRSELYAACYLCDEQHEQDGLVSYSLLQLTDYLLLPPLQLAARLQEQADTWFAVPGERGTPPFLLCGEISAASRQALREQLQERCLFVNNVQGARRASTLATMALQRLQDGKEDDPLLLEPLYLRRPSITKSTRKQSLLGALADSIASA